MLHKDSALGYRHAIHNWSVADAAARAALSVAASDVGKICFQQDTSALYYLLDDLPMTWYKFGDAGSATSDTLIVGDPGTEGSGITVGGVTYESTFKVSDIDGTNVAQTILHRHSTTLEPMIVGARSNSNDTSHVDVTAGMSVFSVYGVGIAGTDYKIFGRISMKADATGTISNTSAPGAMEFAVTADGAVSPTVAISITNDGLVTIPKLRADSLSTLLETNGEIASYEIVLADADLIVEMDVAVGNSLTVPLNATTAFPVGTMVHILQVGAGQTTVVATGGVTINSSSTLKLRAQWSVATLLKRATDTWLLFGDLEAAP